MRRIFPLAAFLAALMIVTGSAPAQSGKERPAVDKGIAFLKAQVPQMNVGQAGISALAIIKSGAPLNDPGLIGCLQKIAPTFNGPAYTPETRGGPDLYETSVVVLALVNIDPIGYKEQIDAAAQYLISKQMANGSWDYSDRTQGDTSMSQYALLALWEAENAGIVVPPQVWDKAASWYLSVQGQAGSWNYHRDTASWPETISMTAAGIGSLMICQEQLARHRKGQDLMNPLMIPITIDGQPAESRYKVGTSPVDIKNSIARGVAWMAGHFQVNTTEIMGQSPYYALYGIERMVALGGDKTLGDIKWYDKGLDFVLNTQKGTGAWNAQHEDVPNTCWAVLFSVKATIISIKKIEIRKLAAGQQKAGVGLPSDLTNVDVVGGQLVAKPMGGAIEGMLKVLEDPRAENADSALAGLVAKYQTDGPKILRPLKDRFRRLAIDKDPGIRRVAVWGLGRTGDLDVAPALIKAVLDDDEDVVMEARIGLQVLSRKLDGYGPDYKADLPAREESARKWRDWFESVKPPDLDAPVDILPAASGEEKKASAK